MNKKVGFIILAIIIALNSCASKPKEVSELKNVFDKFKVDGSFLIYNQNKNVYMGYNFERCNIHFCMASTFKISNTLIAFESGIATPETILKWNGEKGVFQAGKRI